MPEQGSGVIRGLSLTQPWATLVAIGAKKVETRSWGTRYRGRVAIHAAKGFPTYARALAGHNRWARAALAEAGYGITRALPLGAIIAVATLADVRGTGPNELQPAGWIFDLIGQEQAFGDYSPRRFGWFLEDVQPLANPIPCRGALGLWEVPADVLAMIDERLEAIHA